MATCPAAHIERAALKRSLAATLLLAGLGFLLGHLANSHAILLDSLFSLLSMGMTGLGLLTAWLITRPEDRYFQYGYALLEPFANVINGSLILGMCILAAIGGWYALDQGGRSTDLEIGLAYATLSSLICSGLYLWQRRAARKSASSLVEIDAHEWLIDSLLSITVLLGFIAAELAARMGYAHLRPYVDPLLTLILAGVAAILPLRVLTQNLAQLLRIAPDQQLCRQVDHQVQRLAERHGFRRCTSHLAKSGRRYELEINILVPATASWPIARQDQVRQEIWGELKPKLGPTWLSVCFTADPRWL